MNEHSLTTRRAFLRHTGAMGAALPFLGLPLARAAAARQEGQEPAAPVRLGSGRHTYEWVHGWGDLPEGMTYGNTHGCIVIDSNGRVYVNTDTGNAVVMFDTSGDYQGAWGEKFRGGLHGMCVRQEADGEFLYMTHTGRHEVVKCTLDGEVQWAIGVPQEAGIYQDANQYKPTSVAVGPGGDVYVADGYGLSWVHQFDPEGSYVRSFGGPGTEPGKMRTPHGIYLDPRYGDPVLVVADRENHRLQIFDLEGKLLHVVDEHLRRPCHVHHHGDDLVVADLAGRVTILGKDHQLLTHLGDNPDPAKRAKNGVPPDQWRDGEFISPHCAHFDAAGDLYVMDWVSAGRVSKLRRVGADAPGEDG